MRFLTLMMVFVACNSNWILCDEKSNYCDNPEEYYDTDGDGYADAYGYAGDDCDDNDAAINPGAVTTCDGAVFDANCDGIEDTQTCDVDGDGFTPFDGDCNDGDRDSYPGAPEYCGDAVNQDCDEYPDDRTDPSCTSPEDSGETGEATDTGSAGDDTGA